jgi:hypothetical protein
MKAVKPKNGAKTRKGMNLARQEPGRARRQSCRLEPRIDAALAAEGIGSLIVHIARIALATLREIFDESAYERFLSRTHMTSSAHAYAAFLHDKESGKPPRPRCC